MNADVKALPEHIASHIGAAGRALAVPRKGWAAHSAHARARAAQAQTHSDPGRIVPASGMARALELPPRTHYLRAEGSRADDATTALAPADFIGRRAHVIRVEAKGGREGARTRGTARTHTALAAVPYSRQLRTGDRRAPRGLGAMRSESLVS